jgi:carbon monoxide dehydrogenase subunit G
MSALKSSEQVSDGPPGVGTTFHDVFEDHGQRFEIESEVIEYEPHSRVAIRLVASAFESTVTQALAERDGVTELKTTIDTEYKSALARLMSGVVTGHAQKTLEDDLARLKDLLESS